MHFNGPITSSDQVKSGCNRLLRPGGSFPEQAQFPSSQTDHLVLFPVPSERERNQSTEHGDTHCCQ